jgi:hypothetical protein
MYVPFEQLPSDSRIWIYQANRSFSNAEEKIIDSALNAFCSQWAAHGYPLQTSYTIAHKQFLVLSVNESAADASGCSIDGSVRVLKDLGEQLEIDFFDRSKIAFLIGDAVTIYPLQELPNLFRSGVLNSQSVTLNNLVANKGDYEKNWKAIVENSWLVKYLPKPTLSV